MLRFNLISYYIWLLIAYIWLLIAPPISMKELTFFPRCESDSMVGKQKEMVELEGSRGKKKKKEGGTPRPAYSWVHFSRELIKEYSASHPESSGNKSSFRCLESDDT